MRRLFFALLILVFTASTQLANDWPQFRGPDGQGHSSVMTVPLKWSDDSDNIAWRTAVDGLGWSSPVVQGNRVWLTTATDKGRSFRAICLDLETGRQTRNVELFQRDKPLKIHKKNSHASPSAILEDDRVYVHFGTYGTACLSQDGKILWRTTLEYHHVHGPGGSPALFEDLLIISCDGREGPFVVALDKEDGSERWRTERPDSPVTRKFSFCTPLVIDVRGESQVVVPGSGYVCSYEPSTGRQIWQVNYGQGYSVIPRPVYDSGLVFVATGWGRPSLLAIEADGTGDVTDSHVRWSMDRGAPHSPSTLVVGDELYVVSDNGIANCLDLRSGKRHWQKRLGGNYSASPLFAAGRIYFLDEDGTAIVIQPGKKYKELARNKVSGRTLASLTPVEGAMLLRTDTHLLRIDSER